MKIHSIVTAMMLAATSVHAQSPTGKANRGFVVCLDGDVAKSAALRAEASGSRMFGAIGVTIIWRQNVRDCAAEDVRVNLRRDTPATLKPGALAYARPYESTYIQVFYDRIASNWDPSMVPAILAHVLVHEITHTLEAIDRHSAYGIMKAHWDAKDYFRMRSKPLDFAPEDIDLIYRGLASRSHRLRPAMNAKLTF